MKYTFVDSLFLFAKLTLPNDLCGAASKKNARRIEPANIYRCSDTVETICACCGGFYFAAVLTLYNSSGVKLPMEGWFVRPFAFDEYRKYEGLRFFQLIRTRDFDNGTRRRRRIANARIDCPNGQCSLDFASLSVRDRNARFMQSTWHVLQIPDDRCAFTLNGTFIR